MCKPVEQTCLLADREIHQPCFKMDLFTRPKQKPKYLQRPKTKQNWKQINQKLKCFKSNQNRYFKANTREASKQAKDSDQHQVFGLGGTVIPDSKNSNPSTRDKHYGAVTRENKPTLPRTQSLFIPFEDGRSSQQDLTARLIDSQARCREEGGEQDVILPGFLRVHSISLGCLSVSVEGGILVIRPLL